MNDEIQDIEKLIRQSGELSDSLIRLARKLQERDRHRAQRHEERAQNLATLHRELNDLSSHIDLVNNEIGLRQYYKQDEAYVKARVAVADGTATPQEAVVELLRVGVTDKSMSPDFAVEQWPSYFVKICLYRAGSRSAKRLKRLLRLVMMFSARSGHF